jgi:hypothetical protein
MKAVCLRCGAFKDGAWNRCNECNYRPVGDEEKAKHLLLSSHFNNEKILQQYSDHIKSKKEIDFKEKDLDMVTKILNKKFEHRQYQKIYLMKLTGAFLLTIVFIVIFYFVKKNS